MADIGNPIAYDEQRRVLDNLNIVQSVLGIPMIEIEQLNPRIRLLNGAMVVKAHRTGGDVEDPESVIQYDYEYQGGEISFIPNPYPRKPLGTGKICFLVDDQNDPLGKAVDVPENAMSGEPTGWNRELLASHYGECYWRIVDPKIDMEIRDRYRRILINLGKPEKEADEMVAKAVEIQTKGMSTGQKVSVRQVGTTPFQANKMIARDHITKVVKTAEPSNENEQLKNENDTLRKQIAEMNANIQKLLSNKAKGERLAEGRKRAASKRAASAKAPAPAPVGVGNLGG